MYIYTFVLTSMPRVIQEEERASVTNCNIDQNLSAGSIVHVYQAQTFSAAIAARAEYIQAVHNSSFHMLDPFSLHLALIDARNEFVSFVQHQPSFCGGTRLRHIGQWQRKRSLVCPFAPQI